MKKLDWVTIAVFGYILVAVTWVAILSSASLFESELSVGADTVLPIAGTTYTLSGAGISSSDTSFTLTSFTLPQTGTEITDSDMSETFYMTIEPGSRSRQEIVSCTTVTQNADNTATISGCSRGLLPISPYTASTEYAFSHAGGSAVIVSDPPQLFNQTTFKDNDETITGSWSFPTPLSNSNAATKEYVDTNVNGGTVSNDRFVVAGNAGETVATGTLVYFDGADQEWKKVDVDTSSTYQDKFIGLTQGDGTDGNAIQGGILLSGRDTTQTGLTPGSTYYASTSAGTITTDTTDSNVQPVGIAENTNVLYFDPVLVDVPFKNQDNTFSKSNTFSGTTTFSGAAHFTGELQGTVYKIAASSSRISQNISTEETFISHTIPGGALSTNNAVRVRLYISDLDSSAGSQSVDVNLTYGGTNVATTTINLGNTTNLNGIVEAMIFADNSASAQFGWLNTEIAQNTSTDIDYGSDVTTRFATLLDTGTAAVDSTADQTLTVTMTQASGAGSITVTPAGYTVESIE